MLSFLDTGNVVVELSDDAASAVRGGQHKWLEKLATGRMAIFTYRDDKQSSQADLV